MDVSQNALLACIMFVRIQIEAQCPTVHPTLVEYRTTCEPWVGIVTGLPFREGNRILEHGADVIADNFCRGVK